MILKETFLLLKQISVLMPSYCFLFILDFPQLNMYNYLETWCYFPHQMINYMKNGQFLTHCCCCIASVVSDSVRPHRRQPTRLLCPWDSPGKDTGVGCHCLLQCMKVKSESEAAQSCPTLSHPMDWSLPGSSVYEIFQARVLEWGAIAFSKMLC